MADDASNDDQWLYGDSMTDSLDANNDASEERKVDKPDQQTEKDVSLASLDQPESQEQENLAEQSTDGNAADDAPATEDNDDKNEGEIDDDDDDDSDDDVNVVIGDIKTTPATYSSLNIKRGGLLTSAGGIDKLKQQPGKFSIEEFEQIGTINGIPAHEYNLDSLEDKPWRKPGADITDYFNYGFNEETWRAYCERQKRMRVHESGVGLGPLGPPPGRKMGGSIDVIGSGGGTLASRRTTDIETPPKENVIQVMTADRREYSRKNPGFPDMSVPPPTGLPPPNFDVPPLLPVPGPFPPPPRIHPPAPYGPDQFYSPDTDPYYQSYEPTQEQQWLGHQEAFGSRDDPHPGMPGGPSSSLKSKDDKESSKSSRDRDRDKDKHSRSHRHRSRSRSPSERKRRHKSRSRSPSHRSHRKKKSKKSDKSKDDDSD